MNRQLYREKLIEILQALPATLPPRPLLLGKKMTPTEWADAIIRQEVPGPNLSKHVRRWTVLQLRDMTDHPFDKPRRNRKKIHEPRRIHMKKVENSELVEVAGLKLNTTDCDISVDGLTWAHMAPISFELLQWFIDRQGQVCTHDEIAEVILTRMFQRIFALREAFKAIGYLGSVKLIYGVGYIFEPRSVVD